MSSLISTSNICYTINNATLLSDISVEIHSNQILAIVGPNGASKTTLLKALSGEIQPTSGEVYLGDKRIDELPVKQLAKRMAVLPQLSLLNFPYSVYEVVSLGRIPHDTGIEIDKKIVNEVLNACDIEHLKHRDYTKLSGGEKQRTQLARVFAQIWDNNESPKVLLLDEPTSALDLGHQQQLMNILRRLKQNNVAVVIVVHDLNIAAAHADTTLALSCGRQVFHGPTDMFLDEKRLSELFNANIKLWKNDKEGGRKVVVL